MKNFPARSAFALAAVLALAVFADAAPAKLLVTGATLLTMKPGDETPFTGYFAVGPDGKISAIGKGAPPADLTAAETIDATGKIITPGFISAHSHIWQSAFRGLGANQFVRGWGLAVRVFSIYSTDDDIYWFTLHGWLDHLRHGITSAYNFGYSHRAGDTYNEAQLKASLDSGVRFIHSFAQARTVPDEEQYRGFVKFYNYAKPFMSDPHFLRLAISGGATAEMVKLDKRLMDEFHVFNETHFLELPVGKEEQQANFKNFVELGSLGPNQIFGHFIHTTDEMLKATAAAGSGMSWNPLSNGRLASGIADIPKYLKLGVKVGMGVDGQASADLPDPFENMRVGLYMIRGKYESSSIMQPIDILRLHTMGSAEVLGIADKVGSLETGKFADFCVIAPNQGIDRAPVFDAYATVVFACNTANLDSVYVGGEKLSDHLKLTRADMAKVSAEVDARVRKTQAAAKKVASSP